MPILSSIEYKPSVWLRGGHSNTLLSHLFRSKNICDFTRHRLTTPDDDFLDVDGIFNQNKKLVILCHGLEGDSSSSYVQEFAVGFSKEGFDVVAMNYRGCSGEMNKAPRLYHSGSTDDVHFVLQSYHAAYESVFLIGFSLGGNLTLKLLGEKVYDIPANLKAAIAISTPADLETCALKLIQRENWIYEKRFLVSLTNKVKLKAEQFPDLIDTQKLKDAKNLYLFDDIFVAPLHGFKNALDYYTQCSSKQFLTNIEIPTLMISATDDPFLSEKSIPYNEAKENDNLFLYPCKYGGHVGFYNGKNQKSWMEIKSLEFILKHI